MLRSKAVKNAILKEIKEESYDLDNKNKLRDLFYSKLKYPILHRTSKNIPSVKIGYISKLAKEKKANCNVKRGRYSDVTLNHVLLVNGAYLDTLEYPIAYLVLKYLKYKKEER